MNKKELLVVVFLILMLLLISIANSQQEKRTWIVINEIVAKSAHGGPDWIEILAIGDDPNQPIHLEGFFITDGKKGRVPEPLPAIDLYPGECVIIYADHLPNGIETGYTVSFKLGSEDLLMLLYKGNIVETLQWKEGDAPKGFSYARFVGSEGEQFFAQAIPTLGEPNQISLEGTTEGISTNQGSSLIFPDDIVIPVEITINPDDLQAMLDRPLAKEYYPATLIYNGIQIDNVAIRTKGNSSLNTAASSATVRYSFKVDINEYVKDQTLMGLKKISLNNGFSDPTFMREYLSYRIFEEMGVPSARTCFVFLTINGQPWGLYLAVEQIDSVFVAEWFDQTNGDLYKPSGIGSSLLWNGESIDRYPGLRDNLKTNEKTSNHEALMRFLDVLNHGGDLSTVLNVDGAVRYLAVSTALSNLDSYQGPFAHNYYLYEQNGVFEVIPWDLNMSFAGFSHGMIQDQLVGFRIDEPTTVPIEQRVLIQRLLEQDEYARLYYGYIRQVAEEVLDPLRMKEWIEQVAEMIRPWLEEDPTKFYSMQQFETSLWEGSALDEMVPSGLEPREMPFVGQGDHWGQPDPNWFPPEGDNPGVPLPQALQQEGQVMRSLGRNEFQNPQMQPPIQRDQMQRMEMPAQAGGGRGFGSATTIGLYPFILSRRDQIFQQLEAQTSE